MPNFLRLDFTITNWAAWAPGLTTQDAWRAWAASPPVAPLGTETPPLTEVPPMARRRLEKLGRPAFQVAQWCQGDAKGMPLIFASRHGDPGRGADLLTSLAKNEPLSPASFALSVHNAVAAQYSIIRGDTSNVSAVSNGLFTLEAAMMEAAGHLADGQPEVMVVNYDAGPPAIYASHYDEPYSDFAYAWRITKGNQFSLEDAELPPSTSTAVPHGLSVLRFVLGNEPSYARADQTAGWRWSRHA